MTHAINYRVYFEDTDAGGVMYHGNYINFCERGRTEFLRDCGYTNTQIVDDHNVLFLVRHMDINYLKPAFLEDDLTVKTQIGSIKNSSLVMKQSIHKGDTTIFTADVTLVCVDKNTIKPTRVPADIKEAFTNHGN